jgi:hypothetical protein
MLEVAGLEGKGVPVGAAMRRGEARRALGGVALNTYDSAAAAEADRAQQLRPLAALGAWDRALRRDKLAAWCITGTRGRIYADGMGWVPHVTGRSALHWSAVRARLMTSCTVTMDGDDEGVARLARSADARAGGGDTGGSGHLGASGRVHRAQGAPQAHWLLVSPTGNADLGRRDRRERGGLGE